MTKMMETDYLVVGGGAMGTAFVDEILNSDPKATIVIIDRRDRLAGHWNDAYPYVTLHQPAAFYGVNSKVLGNGSTDLSSKPEILAYYDEVLKDFNNSGRVTFLGGYEYLGDKKAAPLNDLDDVTAFTVNRRVVNATYMGVEIPSLHPPKFDVDDDVPFVPLNDLVKEHGNWKKFCVLGCGKTGMDAVLFLLKNNVDPENIQWMMPTDMWCFDRASIQVGKVMAEILVHAKTITEQKTASDIFLEIEKTGGIHRIDQAHMPKKWKCATASLEEITELRRIDNKIREGRIKQISPKGVEFQNGVQMEFDEGTLFVNCTADALSAKEAKPVFSPGHIDLQSVFFCQQVFSAAIIAKLELTGMSDVKKNMIGAIPHPQLEGDWADTLSTTFDNALKLHRYFPLWMFRSRLNLLSHEPPLKYVIYAIRVALIAPKMRRAAQKMARVEQISVKEKVVFG